MNLEIEYLFETSLSGNQNVENLFLKKYDWSNSNEKKKEFNIKD